MMIHCLSEDALWIVLGKLVCIRDICTLAQTCAILHTHCDAYIAAHRPLSKLIVNFDALCQHPSTMLLFRGLRECHSFCPPCTNATLMVDMVPATWMDARTRRMRRVFYDAGVATTHWVTRCVDRGGLRHPPSRPYATSSLTIQRLVDGGMQG